jgi:curved DNA-binding protein CbpA
VSPGHFFYYTPRPSPSYLSYRYLLAPNCIPGKYPRVNLTTSNPFGNGKFRIPVRSVEGMNHHKEIQQEQSATMATSVATSHYHVLEIEPTAQPIDIKKAYRRLALQHHPDRNNGSAASTERFKAIGEAYEVLSDPAQRARYDASLKEPVSTTGTNVATGRRYHDFADPFVRFNDLFSNDPFFQEAFRDMDEEFGKRFQSQNTNDATNRRDNEGATRTTTTTTTTAQAPRQANKTGGQQGFFPWLLRACGVDFQMTSVQTSANGEEVTASSYNSKAHSGSYTNKKSRTFLNNGKRVTIQSMERDGNKIEDKYVDNMLVERRVNGFVEPVGQIQNDR